MFACATLSELGNFTRVTPSRFIHCMHCAIHQLDYAIHRPDGAIPSQQLCNALSGTAIHVLLYFIKFIHYLGRFFLEYCLSEK